MAPRGSPLGPLNVREHSSLIGLAARRSLVTGLEPGELQSSGATRKFKQARPRVFPREVPLTFANAPGRYGACN